MAFPASTGESGFPFHRQNMKQKREKVEINVRIAVNISQVGYRGHLLFSISLLYKLKIRFTGVCKSEIHTHRDVHI